MMRNETPLPALPQIDALCVMLSKRIGWDNEYRYQIFASVIIQKIVVYRKLCPLSNGRVFWVTEKKVDINNIDANFPPFASIDDQGNPVGFDIEDR